MCINPVRIPNQMDPVACRNCWQCHKRRINDWVGRCLAEAETADQTIAVTLTYAKDEPNAATLVYRDFQLFMKRLRREGHKVRYIVAGEYGTKKGRAHWHAVLFLYGEKTIDVKYDRRQEWPVWGHGFVYFQKPDFEGFRYVLKYILKDQEQRSAHGHFAMSKKPLIGWPYFERLAQKHVEQKIAPQTIQYTFKEARDQKRQIIKFHMQGKLRERFFATFERKWQEAYGTEPPYSEVAENTYDKIVRLQPDERWQDDEYVQAKMNEWRVERPPPPPEEWEKAVRRKQVHAYVMGGRYDVPYEIDGYGMITFEARGETWQACDEKDVKRRLEELQENTSAALIKKLGDTRRSVLERYRDPPEG